MRMSIMGLKGRTLRSDLVFRSAFRYLPLITTGTLVTVMAPVALVTARTVPLAMVAPLAMTRRPVPAAGTVVVADDVGVVVAGVTPTVDSGALAARAGLGLIEDVSLGVSAAAVLATVVVPAVVAVVEAPVAN